MALKYMRHKKPGELTSVKEVSEYCGCPFDVVASVLQTLSRKELVRSELGIHGGYQIQKDLNKVSLYELIEILQGPIGIVRCLHEGGAENCEIHERCNIISPIQTLNELLIEFYRGMSVGDVLDGVGNRPRLGPRLGQQGLG